jgi:ElaB/YqjD/DUF883 family membrane-anchored ribosome-binding protein
MTATPHLNQALQDTAQDLRVLGQAAKADFQRLQHDAQRLAQTKVIQPGTKFMKETSQQLEEQARRSMSVAREKLDDVYSYVSDNPGRAIVGALAGGILLGLIMRR